MSSCDVDSALCGHKWLSDELTAALITRLKLGEPVPTKEFLRPIFKWMKFSGRYYDPEKAFQFIEWLVLIR